MTTAVVQTVRGPIEPSALGPASVHEHLLTVLDHVAFRLVDTAEGRAFEHADVSLETRWWVRQQWVSVRDNLRLTDEATAIRELARFGSVGGGAIADPTTEGIGRDPEALVRISEAAGVHVVMGAGYYVDGSHPAWIEDAADRSITDAIVADLVSGVGPARIRAGFIGEIGCSWPLTPRERRVLRAAGQAQRETGAPMMVHPGRDPRAIDEIVRELESTGADLERTTIAHLERTVGGPAELVALASRGPWVSFDTFGLETAFYPLNPATIMPNDGGRIALVEAVITAGYGDRILLAQDICQKHRLAAFGGHGYDHLLRDVVPMLVARGHSQAVVDDLVTSNPARVSRLGRRGLGALPVLDGPVPAMELLRVPVTAPSQLPGATHRPRSRGPGHPTGSAGVPRAWAGRGTARGRRSPGPRSADWRISIQAKFGTAVHRCPVAAVQIGPSGLCGIRSR